MLQSLPCLHDLPAKSAILNMNQLNGDFFCNKCLERGTNFRTEKGGNIHVFPYDTTTELPPLVRGQFLHLPAIGAVRDLRDANTYYCGTIRKNSRGVHFDDMATQ